MNFEFLSRNRGQLQILFTGLFLIALIVGVYALTRPEPPDAAELARHARSTRTALALTSAALLGPFPTSTVPTATASEIPTATPTSTRTPTRTPTQTATRVFIVTFTARTSQPRATMTPIPPLPTNTPPPTTQAPTTYP